MFPTYIIIRLDWTIQLQCQIFAVVDELMSKRLVLPVENVRTSLQEPAQCPLEPNRNRRKLLAISTVDLPDGFHTLCRPSGR